MIVCPNCQHEEIVGALFCSECGARLLTTGHLTTQSFRRNPSDVLNPPAELGVTALETGQVVGEESEAILSLHLVDSGNIIHLSDRTDFTLGRVAEGQPIMPDVDLSPFDAYAQGVSRMHAMIKIVNQGVVISDLGSSNGTRINGQKIVPHIDYPLKHGDVVALGKFKIQILIRK